MPFYAIGMSPANAGSPSAPGMSAPVNPYVLEAKLKKILQEEQIKKKFKDFFGVAHFQIQNKQSNETLEKSEFNGLQPLKPIKRPNIRPQNQSAFPVEGSAQMESLSRQKFPRRDNHIAGPATGQLTDLSHPTALKHRKNPFKGIFGSCPSLH